MSNEHPFIFEYHYPDGDIEANVHWSTYEDVIARANAEAREHRCLVKVHKPTEMAVCDGGKK